MNIIFSSKLKNIELKLAMGDIFDAPVEAIVNSEQTDFILSYNHNSLSGQIRSRLGEAVQRELDTETLGQVLGAGTVISTAGGPIFRRIYHAGFHEPSDWPDTYNSEIKVPGKSDAVRDSQETRYFASIGSCISQILSKAAEDQVRQIAFPLIGCGVFGLDERMLILQFLDAVQTFDDNHNRSQSMCIWLTIRNSRQFESTVGVLLEILMTSRNKATAIHLPTTGLPVLDLFAARLRQRNNEDWSKWLLCRYAEIALGLVCHGIGRAVVPAQSPENLFLEDRAPTFGTLGEKANWLAKQPIAHEKVRGADFFVRLIQDSRSYRALEELVVQRNNIAHGRAAAPLEKIRSFVGHGLKLDSWLRELHCKGGFRAEDWRPWIMQPDCRSGQFGIFERWRKKSVRYLVPETGEVFDIPRDSELP